MGLGVGRWNRSVMRELVGEVERKKKLRKKEEKPERERKKIGNFF